MQHIFTTVSFIALFLLGTLVSAQNESIIVLNGGIFSNNAHNVNPTVQVLSPTAAPADTIDVVNTRSIQDILVHHNIAYIAAQDSIVKYDWTTKTRLAAVEFGGNSTIKLALYQDKLFVGNYYASANYPNNLRIFDANTLAFIDNVPDLKKPAKDILIVGDYAYISQNDQTIQSKDTLGYLTIYDILADTIVKHDTLATNGEDLGRLVEENGVIYAINSVSNTISEYNISTGMGATYTPSVDLNTSSYAPTIYNAGNSVWYFPYDSGIGSYNLSTRTALNHHVTYPSTSTGVSRFAYNPYDSTFCVATIYFLNQTMNTGVVYNLQGDSLYTFDVGFSPEALAVVSRRLVSTELLPAQAEELLYTLSPNPTNGQLTVTLEESQTVHLEIINQVGQSMLVEQTNQAQTTLDVSRFPSGTYWMVVIDQQGKMRTQGFVKQ